jgi:uracil permease
MNLSALVPDSVVSLPDFAFLHLDFAAFDWSNLPGILLMFGLVSLAAMTEHVADVKTASEIAESDYINEPGLHRTLLGDGVSSFVGTLTGAQCTTTYSEYTGTMAVSRVASSWITLATALSLIGLAFITPFTNFLATLPNCVFAGVAICAYGMIANTGVKTLMNSHVDFTLNKNIFIFAGMFSAGISGLFIPVNSDFSISGIVLAMIVGIVLNLVLRDRKICKR